jgi:hypothetical protein
VPGFEIDALKNTVSLMPGDCGDVVKSAVGAALPLIATSVVEAAMPRSLLPVSSRRRRPRERVT